MKRLQVLHEEFPDEVKSSYQQDVDEAAEKKRTRREARAMPKVNARASHEQQEEKIKKLFWEGSPLKYYAAMRSDKKTK